MKIADIDAGRMKDKPVSRKKIYLAKLQSIKRETKNKIKGLKFIPYIWSRIIFAELIKNYGVK